MVQYTALYCARFITDVHVFGNVTLTLLQNVDNVADTNAMYLFVITIQVLMGFTKVVNGLDLYHFKNFFHIELTHNSVNDIPFYAEAFSD